MDEDKVNDKSREMNIDLKNNYILSGCALTLLVLCALSLHRPAQFQREQAAREAVVKRRLLTIKAAEERYKCQNAIYTGSLDKLVEAKLIADSTKIIPFSDNKPFSLEATTIIGKSGKQIPLMECSASYKDYLNGLDDDAIAEITEKANAMGRFPGLKIGDINEPNDNAPNWH